MRELRAVHEARGGENEVWAAERLENEFSRKEERRADAEAVRTSRSAARRGETQEHRLKPMLRGKARRD
jgi:hypothetical protein